MTESAPSGALHEQLARWVAGGLIGAAQAARIEAAENTRAAKRQPQARAAQQPATVPPAPQARPAAAVRPPAAAAAAGSVSGRRASPLVVEALGYLGGALAVAAGLDAARPIWPDIPLAAQLAVGVWHLDAASAVPLAAGAATGYAVPLWLVVGGPAVIPLPLLPLWILLAARERHAAVAAPDTDLTLRPAAP